MVSRFVHNIHKKVIAPSFMHAYPFVTDCPFLFPETSAILIHARDDGMGLPDRALSVFNIGV